MSNMEDEKKKCGDKLASRFHPIDFSDILGFPKDDLDPSDVYEIEYTRDFNGDGDSTILHTSISNEDPEKQCSEKSDWVQLVEDFSQPSSLHTEVLYALEQFGAYTWNYQHISPFDEYDDLPHHANLYISPIQSWMEEACKRTCQLWKQFSKVLRTCDFPSNPPFLDHHAGLHFLNKIFLLWPVTKDKEKPFYINKMLRWLHWIYDYT